MKFRGHETFTIRKGWLHKGLKHICKNDRVFVDRTVNPMDEFGLGSNMVKSLRYWLQAVGLTVEENARDGRHQRMTPFGDLVWKNDAYFEEDGTLLLLHYFLASNKDLATAWYYFFNYYNMVDITQENFLNGIKAYLLAQKEDTQKNQFADRVLKDDYDCIIKTYFNNNTKISPESNMECPLTELGLISMVDKKAKIYTKTPPKRLNIHPLIVLAVIVNENKKNHGSNDIKISNLENDPCNIGRIFNLDSMAIAIYLDKLQTLGYIKVNRTAGLDLIKLQKEYDFIQCVTDYYRSIND